MTLVSIQSRQIQAGGPEVVLKSMERKRFNLLKIHHFQNLLEDVCEW